MVYDGIYVYTCLGKFHHDLTVFPSPGNHREERESSLFMAGRFRFLKYTNKLPTKMSGSAIATYRGHPGSIIIPS